MTSLQGCCGQWSLRVSDSRCLTLFTGWYTRGYVPLHTWSATGLCGLGFSADIKEWSRQCVASCRAKVTHVEHSVVEKIPIPGVRFSHVHVDLVGPLRASRDGSTYLVTMIDQSTRWPEAVPLGCIDVETVLEAFITTWVAHFGMPAASSPTGRHSSPLACGETGVRSRESSTSPPLPTTHKLKVWRSRSTTR